MCQHHWVIEPARGKTSQGVCRVCGEKKAFRNSIQGWPRDYSPNREMQFRRLNKGRMAAPTRY